MKLRRALRFLPDVDGALAMCYGGGVGYEAYGQQGLARRARTYKATLGTAGELTIGTHKTLDHTWETVDSQSLYPWAAGPRAPEEAAGVALPPR